MKTGKLFLTIVVFLAGSLVLKAQEENSENNGPQISFDKETHDYGEIFMHGDGNCVFTFTNTGNEPLLLTNVRAGCGCTVPQWPREPVLPGDSAEIKVRYTTLNRPHSINRSIVVTSNAINKPSLVIRLKGKVVEPPPDFSPEKNLDIGGTPASR
ncbi:MAG TPA: DUF1573 domain-containing protein [Bacteroidales bacterium]|nr:DUF1573 domain-containing protein [Bacteroidales bacterium]